MINNSARRPHGASHLAVPKIATLKMLPSLFCYTSMPQLHSSLTIGGSLNASYTMSSVLD
ncbi:hypothetical protein M404DRAFT_1005017 [Pisolithus tinctorius Marx 270]|uniref:Uncharacterized protein n=1 Tax=Pisolithus tinctorius Marx 270 TaxID=870435 RepID=A0A0C3ND58_PISTI|nr:hypothetical protein M404DRAFT_1005017 [Pisolithus tinctorius Marx 270]